MNEREMGRLIKEVMKLLQNMYEEEVEGGREIEERIEEIKRELGSWFIGDYPLYQAS
uniref:Uncharacterized protein n=1 Tax=Candidatus Methanophagaceae archaeon ANME-1 ERB6 TaxID=2759912 RepID=A0A7G9YWX3_9EURY|nr:hypothetical protein CGEPLDJD_00028 [Methanosarcinales archaeon ANME-1 ERB6]